MPIAVVGFMAYTGSGMEQAYKTLGKKYVGSLSDRELLDFDRLYEEMVK